MSNNTRPLTWGKKVGRTDVSFDDYVCVRSWQGYTRSGAHSVSWSLQDKILPGAVLAAARNPARTPAAWEKEKESEREEKPN